MLSAVAAARGFTFSAQQGVREREMEERVSFIRKQCP